MRFFKEYNNIVAIQECAQGNEAVGSMWLETKAFKPETPINEIVAWANSCACADGKLIITIGEPERK